MQDHHTKSEPDTAPSALADLTHRAGEQAAQSWAHLEETASALERRAGEVFDGALVETKRVGASVSRFASTHALPLLLVGAGLSWLSLSVRKDRQRRAFVQPGYGERAPSMLTNRRPSYYDYDQEPPRPFATASGAKLEGVHLHETRYAQR